VFVCESYFSKLLRFRRAPHPTLSQGGEGKLLTLIKQPVALSIRIRQPL